MRIHSDYLTVQTKQQRESSTSPRTCGTRRKKAGSATVILVSSLHGNSAIFVNDEEAGLLQDIDEWAGKLAPFGAQYHHARSESNAGAHLQSLLLNHQTLVSLADGKIELGPWRKCDLRGTGWHAAEEDPHQSDGGMMGNGRRQRVPGAG